MVEVGFEHKSVDPEIHILLPISYLYHIFHISSIWNPELEKGRNIKENTVYLIYKDGKRLRNSTWENLMEMGIVFLIAKFVKAMK